MKNFVFAATLLFAALFIVSCSSKNEQAQATIDSLKTANSSLDAKVASLQDQMAWRDTCHFKFKTHDERVGKIVQLMVEHMSGYKNLRMSTMGGITDKDVCDVFRMFTETNALGSLKHFTPEEGVFFFLYTRPDGTTLRGFVESDASMVGLFRNRQEAKSATAYDINSIWVVQSTRY